MRLKLITLIIAFLLLANLSSAVVSFYQETIELPDDEHITRTANSVFWIAGAFPTDPTVKDVITSDDLLEIEIDYSIYPQTWNDRSPDYEIENCTLTINYFENKLNQSYVFYEETVNKNESDILGKKYFVRVPQKDGISVFMDCYFANASQRILDTPTELTVRLPTYECKACQYYEWNVEQRDIAKAQTIGNNTVTIIDYIKEFFILNFELLLAVFWFILILLLFAGVGLIFIGMYGLFNWLRKIAREL